MKTTIHNAILVVVLDGGYADDIDGDRVLRLIARAEDNLLEACKDEVMTGNLTEFGGLTPNGRRNVLHTERDMEFVDSLIQQTESVTPGGLFA